ncbi:MAG: hypothetical protein IKT87_05560 [Bacteroidaceae bacterium]|nr:hypothetical protein [Bacteroidaceae bacterium]
MKKIYKSIMFAAAATMLSGAVSAQNLNSAYFLDGYTYGHQLNPAKDYDRNGYVSFPVLGNYNVGMTGNLSLTDFLKFDPKGQLTTFMNPSISVKDALSGFSANNNLNMDMRMEILSFGFHAWGGYNTFSLGMRANSGINAPYELFEFAKNLTNKDYDISDVSSTASVWSEIGLGHSRKVADAWRVGGKVKFLVGGARTKVQLKNAHLNLTGTDQWILSANAQADVSIKGFGWGEMEKNKYSDGSSYEQINFDNVELQSNQIGPNGFGLAFDLGAEWDLEEQGWVEGMKVSASLLDLGFISWKENHNAYNLGKEVVFTGFNDIQIGNGPGVSVDDQADDYGDRFSSLLAMQDGGVSKLTTSLGATMNIGVEYAMPFYKKLSVGLLSTTRFQGEYTWNEERISATISPVKWFELSANFGFGTRGTSFGWVANIHPRGFNLFVGMDHMVGTLSKQGVPLKSNTGLTFGINFPFGKSKM